MTAPILRTVAARSDLRHSEISSDGCANIAPVARSLPKRATEKWAQEAEKFGASAKAERLRQDLPHKQKRQRRAQRNQERPDKEFQPINRGHIARPQIVPTRHGGNPPSPWQSDPNAEPRLLFRRRPTIVQRRGLSLVCGDRSVGAFHPNFRQRSTTRG
jgi:hypothetical protein